jgi:hypothetical protein
VQSCRAALEVLREDGRLSARQTSPIGMDRLLRSSFGLFECRRKCRMCLSIIPHQQYHLAPRPTAGDLCAIKPGIRSMLANASDQPIRLDAADAASLAVAPMRGLHQLPRLNQRFRRTHPLGAIDRRDEFMHAPILVNMMLRP